MVLCLHWLCKLRSCCIKVPTQQPLYGKIWSGWAQVALPRHNLPLPSLCSTFPPWHKLPSWAQGTVPGHKLPFLGSSHPPWTQVTFPGYKSHSLSTNRTPSQVASLRHKLTSLGTSNPHQALFVLSRHKGSSPVTSGSLQAQVSLPR